MPQTLSSSDAVYDIRAYDTVDSTQNALKSLWDDGKADGFTAVLSRTQSRGRGRHGRFWISPAGNLHISMLLLPKVKREMIGHISILAGLALFKALKDICIAPDGLSLKWPNDILYKGRKCAGILLETGDPVSGERLPVFFGAGVNIAEAPEGGALLECSTPCRLEDLARRCIDALKHALATYEKSGFSKIREEWLTHAHRPGTPITVKRGVQPVAGMFYKLDDTGSLLLRTHDGQIKTITAGEVFLDDASRN